MVQGLLGMPEVANPQRAAAQTMQDMQMQRALQLGYFSPPAAPGGAQQQPYMTPQNINEVYGILAANANDPAAVGQGYVRSMQSQQQLDTQNSPMERWLRLYGNINPYDFTEDSLADFHDTLVKTGDMAQAFRKLVRVEKMSSANQEFLIEAINNFQSDETAMQKAMGLAQQFDELHKTGGYTGAAGQLEEWMRTATGNENAVSLMRAEYNRLRNSEVVRGLPKGPASDKDIAIFERGFPPSTANAAYIASFLRGMAKAKALEMAKSMHRAHFLSRNTSAQGLLTDWNQDKDYWTFKALESAGGVYAPMKPDGTFMTADEAMNARFSGVTRVEETPADDFSRERQRRLVEQYLPKK